MTKKILVSAAKFKKLYFYKFLFIQIWYGLSFVELFVIIYALPKGLTRSLLHSSMVYPIFIPMGISGILWLFSLGWYASMRAVKRSAFIIKEKEGFVFQTVRQRWQLYSPWPQFDCYTYTVKNISNISRRKYSIAVDGDITMKRSHSFEPKTILNTKQYSHLKILNIFDDAFDSEFA